MDFTQLAHRIGYAFFTDTEAWPASSNLVAQFRDAISNQKCRIYVLCAGPDRTALITQCISQIDQECKKSPLRDWWQRTVDLQLNHSDKGPSNRPHY